MSLLCILRTYILKRTYRGIRGLIIFLFSRFLVKNLISRIGFERSIFINSNLDRRLLDRRVIFLNNRQSIYVGYKFKNFFRVGEATPFTNIGMGSTKFRNNTTDVSIRAIASILIHPEIIHLLKNRCFINDKCRIAIGERNPISITNLLNGFHNGSELIGNHKTGEIFHLNKILIKSAVVLDRDSTSRNQHLSFGETRHFVKRCFKLIYNSWSSYLWEFYTTLLNCHFG